MRFFKTILSVALLIIMSAGLYLAYTDKYYFSIQEISVALSDHGVSPKLKDKLVSEIEEELVSFKKRNIWQVSLAELQTQIQNNKWVRRVRLRRRLPNTLEVNVELNKIAFVYVGKNKRFTPITLSGELLESMPLSYLPDVPLMRDHQLLKDEKRRQRLLELYRLLPQEGVVSQSAIAEVAWDRLRGLKVELIKHQGAVLLGTSDIQLRVRRVENVLNYLQSQKQKWRVIDASFSKKVLVSMRKHS